MTQQMKDLMYQTIPQTDLQANQEKDTLTTQELAEILKNMTKKTA